MNITFIKQTVQSLHETEVAIKTKYSPTPMTQLLIFVIFQYLRRQGPGEWGSFFLKSVEFGVGVVPWVSVGLLIRQVQQGYARR